MCAGLGSSPYDAMPFIISRHVKKVSFKVVRMIWDISFMTAGFLLGGRCWHCHCSCGLFPRTNHHMDAEKDGGTDCINDRA